VTTGELLAGLPRIRSKLSKQDDSEKVWLEVLRRGYLELDDWIDPRKSEIKSVMEAAVKRANNFLSLRGGGANWDEVAALDPQSELYRWISGRGTIPLTQHNPRKHMETDLYRYLFAASYARVVGHSPKLRNFPERVLPAHKNAKQVDAPNTDRFRVQMEGRPSTTVTSHISKDGHYYIHPDPSQCRSLSVREAARLQTFPDDYFFLGEQTQSYHQVGNAVPPYLAWKLGEIVGDLLRNKKAIRCT
jgi:DNA (cytosine-5)-methyltransferase 1